MIKKKKRVYGLKCKKGFSAVSFFMNKFIYMASALSETRALSAAFEDVPKITHVQGIRNVLQLITPLKIIHKSGNLIIKNL